MSSSNSDRNKFSDSQETEKNQEKIDIEDIIVDNPLAIKKLYPRLSLDGKIAKNLLISNEKEPIFKKNKPGFLMDENDNSNLLTENFLKDLVKKPCPLERDIIIEVMTEFIQNSPMIKKFQKDVQMDKKVENNELSRMGAEILSYMELKEGQVLFRIGDNGDRFYFILSGRVSILKLKEINNVQLNYFEYLDYCMYLIAQKEYYIFNKVKNRNMKLISLNSEEDVISIYKIFFMKKLKEAVIGDLVPDIKSLMKYLKKYGFKLQDFNIKIASLEKIENNPNISQEFKREEWNEYLINKCKPSFQDLMIYEQYKNLFQDEEKKSFSCFIYKPFLFLGKGLFFGDFALDSDNNKRNATIRAEENTILAFMKSADYINIFAPGRRIEKMKEINFLYSNYFFGSINLRSFEKHYFHLFSPHEFYRNHELFDFGNPMENLILLKEGKVSLELKASIVDLHDLIKYLWENIGENKFFKTLNYNQKRNLITSSIENRIQNYINEPLFSNLKSNGDKFLEEMNRIKSFQVCIFTNKEIIGLEEFYLGIPYITKGTVFGNKISFYQIDVDNFENLLKQEKQIIYHFVQSSVNKIISLIDRLQSLKINQIKMCKNKFEMEFSEFLEINKINNENIDKSSININNNLDYSMNYGINLQKINLIDKIKKSPIKIASANLNPIVQFINLKRKKLNKKYNNNNSNSSISTEKITNFSSAHNYKNDSILNKYNSYIFKKINESKNNIQSSNEDITSENNITNTKNESNNIISNNSNNSKRKKIKLNFNSQRSFSFNNIINKNNNIKLKHSFSGIIQKDKMTQNKNNLSMVRNSPERQKIFIYHNYLFNKNIIKNTIEKDNFNEQKINSIWFGQKTRELKKLNSISINEYLKNDGENKEKNFFIENYDSIINNLEEDEKKRKLVISNAIKDFYKGIRNRGYSSFVRNKKSNTILNRKNKRKYLPDCSESVSTLVANQNMNGKNKSKKISAKLPLINNRNNILFS